MGRRSKYMNNSSGSKRFLGAEIVEEVFHDIDELSKDMIWKVYNSVFSAITDKMTEGSVVVRGFGTFESYHSKRNYYSIEEKKMNVSEKNKVKFYPSEGLMKYINANSDKEEINE